jgi:hypothetical protein
MTPLLRLAATDPDTMAKGTNAYAVANNAAQPLTMSTTINCSFLG